jgi:hypothetical protein
VRRFCWESQLRGNSARSHGTTRAAALGPARVKTRAFVLLVEGSSQFGQSENQKCWRRLSEEGNRETGSTLSWLAHIFTQPGSRAALRTRYQAYVWTTPSKQGRSGMLRRGRVRSCVRPTLRGLRTAGPDAIRSLAPKQIYALEWRITLDGFFQAPGLTGSPSRHHRPPHPSAVATADGVPSASGCASWDCGRHAIGFSTHEQSPYDPRRFVSLCH